MRSAVWDQPEAAQVTASTMRRLTDLSDDDQYRWHRAAQREADDLTGL